MTQADANKTVENGKGIVNGLKNNATVLSEQKNDNKNNILFVDNFGESEILSVYWSRRYMMFVAFFR